MSPTRLEWLLQLSIRQMQEAKAEGRKANEMGKWPTACPYKVDTARHFAWLEGWRANERSRQPAED